MSKKDEIRKHKKEGKVLLVASERFYGCYYLSSNKKYNKLLDELQMRLIALDVNENEEQDLTVLFNTKHADKLIADVFELANVIRCKLIKL